MATQREKIGGVIFLVLLGVLVYLFCASRQAPPYGKEEGAFGRMRPGKQFFASLNLTSEQLRMLEENRSRHLELANTLFAQFDEKKGAIRKELQEERLNQEKIFQLAAELKVLQAQMVDERIKGMLEVRKILTPQQFNQFMSKAQAGPGRLFKERKERRNQMF